MQRYLIGIIALFPVAAAATDRPPLDSTDQYIARLERRLKRTPADASARNELAGALLQKTRETADRSYLERAGKLVDRILADNPSHPGARLRRIELEMQRHRFSRAAELAEVAAQESPESGAAWGLLGDAAMELGEYGRAAEAYQRMVDLGPGLASYSRVAMYRFVTGDGAGAVGAMRMAVEAGGPPEYLAWCLSDLGSLLFKIGEGKEAEAEFRKALDLVPGYHRALAGLGKVLAARGAYAEAIRLLGQAQSKAPLPEYYAELAKLYRQVRREDLARKQLDRLDYIDRMGRASGEHGDRNLAMALIDLEHRMERGLELARGEWEVRKDVYTLDALAWALYRNGKVGEAAEAMRQALRWNTPEPLFREHAEQILGRRQH